MVTYEEIVAAYHRALSEKVHNDPDYDWPNKSDAEIDRVCRNMLLAVKTGEASASANRSMLKAMRALGIQTVPEFKALLEKVTPPDTVKIPRGYALTVQSNIGTVHI